MNTIRRISSFLLGIIFATSLFGAWEEGEALPDLGKFQLQGELPSLEGKVTYVDFWASWCPPCKAAFPAMERIYSEHKDEGFQIVAISLDSTKGAMDRFLDRAQPSFAIVWDEEQSLAMAAGIEVMPTSFLIDANGVIRARHRGWGGSASEKELEAEILELLAEAK